MFSFLKNKKKNFKFATRVYAYPLGLKVNDLVRALKNLSTYLFLTFLTSFFFFFCIFDRNATPLK